MTTAYLRSLGYDAALKEDYAEAAKYYRQAADNYPKVTGALAKADIKKLRAYANEYQQAADYQAKNGGK